MTLAVAPKEVAGHGLLTDKVVVVTAAAGTGIGSATARRALTEGADVVVSDYHERRLAETRDELAALELGRVEAIDRMLTAHPALALAGGAYRGVGIADCVRSGEQAVERVSLDPRP